MITKYSEKGADLTYEEMDANWDELLSLMAKFQDNKLTVAGLETSVGNENLNWNIFRNSYNNNITGYGAGLKLKLSNDAAGEIHKWAGVAAIAESGYANNVSMTFLTSAAAQAPVERMRITGAGNVLFGKTTDAGTGRLQLAANANAIAIDITGRAIGDIGLIQFTNNNGTASCYIGGTGNSLYFESGGSERLRIAPTTGNILINTPTDNATGARLQVNGGISMSDGNRLYVSGGTLASSAVAGGVQAVPATVSGYMLIWADGATRKIPYFD